MRSGGCAFRAIGFGMVEPGRALTSGVEAAVREALASAAPRSVVLAVSGGRDSMVLLHAVPAVGLADRIAAVAVFDHRTGPAAVAGADAAADAASRWGLPVARGMAVERMHDADEATWRAARFAFLRAVAQRHAARLATAHTEDDQVETVAFRAWRGSGPRGLAGLDTDGPVLRPLLRVSRAAVAAYAAARGVPFVVDPSNTDRRHARVRWRLDLLPAFERAAPGSRRHWLDLGLRAAAWRRDAEALVSAHVRAEAGPFGVMLSLGALAHVPPDHLVWLWPTMLAPHGVVVDRRGLARLATAPTGRARMPLAGGAELLRLSHERWLLRRATTAPAPTLLTGTVDFGPWRFRPATGRNGGDASPWHARLPADIHLHVRAWAPGDRLAGPAGPRRVKRWLADAGIPGPLREGWPVVAAGANVWWIPGVCQADLPPNGPTLCYDCDRRSR
mgnify:CR=1 FL=1